MLDAHGMKAREIQLVGGSEFLGGKLAHKIWELMLDRLRALASTRKSRSEKISADDPVSTLNAEDLINIHTVAARSALKTIALNSAVTEKLFISVNASGIVDLHDAHVKIKILVDADDLNRIHSIDFGSSAEAHLASNAARSEYERHLLESTRFLTGTLAPCLDLAGLNCEGELRFDGPEQGIDDKSKNATPPVVGHINLVNARCRVYTDDGTWLERATRPGGKSIKQGLTFGLGSFHYEYFGQSRRLLVDSDQEFDRGYWSRSLNGKSAADSAIQREYDRRIKFESYSGSQEHSGADSTNSAWIFWPNRVEPISEGEFDTKPKRGNYSDSSLKLVRVDKRFIKNKLQWLNAAPLDDFENDPLEPTPPEFDAQPWTHCARVLRLAGWRQEADNVLMEREDKIHQSKIKPQSYRFDILIFVTSIFLVSLFQQDPLFERINILFPALILLALSAALLPNGYFPSFWYRLLKTTVGYGFQPKRAIVHSAVIVSAAAIVFFIGSRYDLIIRSPAANNPGAPFEQVTSLEPPSSYFNKNNVSTELRPDARKLEPMFTLASARDYRDCSGIDREQCQRDPINPFQEAKEPQPSKHQSSPPQSTTTAKPGETTSAQDSRAQLTNFYIYNVAKQADQSAPYPDFNPIIFSIDTFIPLIDFSQGAYWVPGFNANRLPISSGTKPQLLDKIFLLVVSLCYWFVIAAGWLYTFMLAATFAGLLERKE
ncbi:MAG: hypothetical protein K8S25_06835 [Alphaproteobacteria bacterium]|nr:hypothetical protein [Alphaproteobacteria bacterium]